MTKGLLFLCSILLALSVFANDLWVPPLLSLAVPGGGQIYNRDYVKAGIIIAVESVLIYSVYDRYTNDGENRELFRDLLSAAILYSVIDAYVSKELKQPETTEEKSDTLQKR